MHYFPLIKYRRPLYARIGYAFAYLVLAVVVAPFVAVADAFLTYGAVASEYLAAALEEVEG